jgi:hypothetical protein
MARNRWARLNPASHPPNSQQNGSKLLFSTTPFHKSSQRASSSLPISVESNQVEAVHNSADKLSYGWADHECTPLANKLKHLQRDSGLTKDAWERRLSVTDKLGYPVYDVYNVLPEWFPMTIELDASDDESLLWGSMNGSDSDKDDVNDDDYDASTHSKASEPSDLSHDGVLTWRLRHGHLHNGKTQDLRASALALDRAKGPEGKGSGSSSEQGSRSSYPARGSKFEVLLPSSLPAVLGVWRSVDGCTHEVMDCGDGEGLSVQHFRPSGKISRRRGAIRSKEGRIMLGHSFMLALVSSERVVWEGKSGRLEWFRAQERDIPPNADA